MSHAEVVYELTHCFGLADFPGCMIQILDDGALINHSGNANLVTNNSAPANASLNVNSRDYLDTVTKALLDDRYALIATRDIEIGEEYNNNYNADCAEPPYFDTLYEQYGVCEDYLDDYNWPKAVIRYWRMRTSAVQRKAAIRQASVLTHVLHRPVERTATS